MNDAFHPLEPSRATMIRNAHLVLDRAVDFVDSLPDRPAYVVERIAAPWDLCGLLAPPPDDPQDLPTLLERIGDAVGQAVETAGPGYLGDVPIGGGLYSAALADFYKSVINRYSSFVATAPGITAIEESVVRWIGRKVLGLPQGSGGLLTSGGDMANFSAVVAARTARLGWDLTAGTIYVSEHTRRSVLRAAGFAGIPRHRIRVAPSTPAMRMDPAAVADMIAADRLAGLRPFMLVAAGGSADTGAVDGLHALADLARQEDLWLHVDASYGGFFALTNRGRARLAGIERADSVTADPHKSLFMPVGVGAILVRDRAALDTEHFATYLGDADPDDHEILPDYANLGLELSREARGLRVWLPLHLHGVRAFRDALDEKLDLAAMAYERLHAMPELEVPWQPELSTLAFRVRVGDDGPDGTGRSADEPTTRLLNRVNASGRAYLTSTVIQNRTFIRMRILSHRTHQDRVDEALELIEKILAGLTSRTVPAHSTTGQWRSAGSPEASRSATPEPANPTGASG